MAYVEGWGKFLKEQIEQTGMASRQVALKTNMSSSTLGNYLDGRVPEHMDIVRKLAIACGGDPAGFVCKYVCKRR